jgi:hypothetical protein
MFPAFLNDSFAKYPTEKKLASAVDEMRYHGHSIVYLWLL